MVILKLWHDRPRGLSPQPRNASWNFWIEKQMDREFFLWSSRLDERKWLKPMANFVAPGRRENALTQINLIAKFRWGSTIRLMLDIQHRVLTLKRKRVDAALVSNNIY
jgi:hypothetical protein